MTFYPAMDHPVRVEMHDHRVRDAGEYENARTYIHQNPVRAGLVERPEDYPYSSANRQFQLDDVPQRLKPVAPIQSGPQG